MNWKTDEYRARYWPEKAKEHQRALDFCEGVKAGDDVRLERYAVPQISPYCLEDNARITYKETVTIYAINKTGLWFTTTKGDAIKAATVIKWETLPKQGVLF